MTLQNERYTTEVYRRNKLPINWSTRAPKKYKRNALNTDLHRAFKISSNFEEEVNIIRQKYHKADYPKKFTESIINNLGKIL